MKPVDKEVFEMSESRCPTCDNYVPPGNEFCNSCGHNLQQGNEPNPNQTPLPEKQTPVVEVVLNENGELPRCPRRCGFRLVWEKLPAPKWALPMFIVGILLSIGCIGVIPLAIGLWGLWMGRPLRPYCPNCKTFFPFPKSQ